MEEEDKGWLVIRRGVSDEWVNVFFLYWLTWVVTDKRAVKRLLMLSLLLLLSAL